MAPKPPVLKSLPKVHVSPLEVKLWPSRPIGLCRGDLRLGDLGGEGDLRLGGEGDLRLGGEGDLRLVVLGIAPPSAPSSASRMAWISAFFILVVTASPRFLASSSKSFFVGAFTFGTFTLGGAFGAFGAFGVFGTFGGDGGALGADRDLDLFRDLDLDARGDGDRADHVVCVVFLYL